jgi:hypothetical protein
MGTENWNASMSRDELFWAKVAQRGDSDCWEWLASKNKDGYGQFWVGDTFIPAHRYAWEHFHKQLSPPNHIVCHHCDNRGCCNPHHLFLGTVSDNNRDMYAKNRHPRIGRPRFNDDEVDRIWRLHNSGHSQERIATIMGTNQSVISRLLRNSMYGKDRRDG